jgi:tetratricopeptide (TPR) repeat protein
VTVIDHWTGASATALRLAMRLSNERFAEHLGVSVRTVAKWRAQPDMTPTPLLQQVLDTALERCDAATLERFTTIAAGRAVGDFRHAEASAQAVNVQDFRGDVSNDEEMLRRQFLSTSAAALTGAVLPGIADSGKAPRLNVTNVTELETVTEAQRRLYHSLPARSIWSSVEGHLRLLIDLVRAPQSELVHRRVAALGGEAAGLLAWLALDLGDERAREWLHNIALSLTAEAEDRPLDAYVRGFRSQVRQLERRPRAALALANQAVATAGTRRAGSIHAWLRSRQAVALAEVKDGRGSLVALAAAEAALARGTADEPAWMYEFDDTRLAAVRGDCLLRLDRPEQAERAFREALAGSSHKGGRFEVELLTGLAMATARQGRVEEACSLGMQSLDVAAVGSELGISRVRRLRQELDRWHDSDEVAALDGRLALPYPRSWRS